MNKNSPLRFLIGTSEGGQSIYGDFTTTGSFISSGCVGSGHASFDEGAFVTSLIQSYSPQELKFIMIDPKQVQLGPYEGIPHLLRPVIYTPDETEAAVAFLLAEVVRRSRLIDSTKSATISQYNDNVMEKLPAIVVLVTEIADLMMINADFYRSSFAALARKSTQLGIYLYLATQRPSADVLTSDLLAAIPGRIVFAVASEQDSNHLLGTSGAEQIKEQGSLLYRSTDTTEPVLVQAPYVSDGEIVTIVNQLQASHE